MNVLALLALAKKYTDGSIAGITGTLAGKNCTVDSITPITGGNRITFKWTADDDTVKTSTMDVMDGTDGEKGDTGQTGKGIKSVEVNSSNHVIVTYTDDSTVDAGEIHNDSCVQKSELAEVTYYIDYTNGSDSNDGTTAATALKTVDEAFNRVSVNTFLTIILCSDYTGNITNSNSLVACVKITSVDTEHPVTINGIVKISYKTYVYLTYVNVLSGITSSLTEAVYFTSCSRVLIQDVDIAVKNTYQNQKGYGIRLNTCANTYIYKNVNIHTTNDSTKTMHSSYVVYGGFICNLESNNTTSGAYRVMSLYNGAIASLRSDFVNVAQCVASEKINLGNSGAVYYLDGKLQEQSFANKVDSATEGNLASLTSSGDLADSGKKAGDFVAKAELPTLSLYIDYTNGSDTNDGTSQATALKTADEAFNRCKINTALTLVLCSDYTGNIIDTNGLIPALTLTSVDTDNPCTVYGRISVQNKAKFDANFVDVVTEITANENSISLTAVTRAYFSDINIKHINTYDDNKGNGFRLTNVSNASFIKNVFVEMDNTSTKRSNANVILDNSTCYISGTCQGSGFARVVALNNGSVLSTVQAFLDNSTSGLGKVLTNSSTSGSYYFIDGKLKVQTIPECPATTDGTFVLKATVSSGAVTYSWVAES
jgi:hypothetical protein